MRFEVLRRVRWGNVARAAGVLALVGAVVAWPRLDAPEPRLPGDEVAPLVSPGDGGRPRDGREGRSRAARRDGGRTGHRAGPRGGGGRSSASRGGGAGRRGGPSRRGGG